MQDNFLAIHFLFRIKAREAPWKSEKPRTERLGSVRGNLMRKKGESNLHGKVRQYALRRCKIVAVCARVSGCFGIK